VATYKAKGITPDPATQSNKAPLMEDLYKVLIGMENEEADDLAARLEKFITGSFRGIFDQPSNIDIRNQFTVFSVKEMEDELRPIAMYVILDFIWTRIKKEMKKRMLIIDEAWYFMQHPDSAQFIYSMAKRARKYYLGITTITQDVEDFIHNDYGKAIVSNASIQFLMKQSTASIPALADTFYLSEGERQLLVSADVGEGIFFAGQNHVALRVVASQEEHEVITTNPEEMTQKQRSKQTNTTQQVIQTQRQRQRRTASQNNQASRERTSNQDSAPQLQTQQQKQQQQSSPKTAPNQLTSQSNNEGRESRDGHYTIDDYQSPQQS
jgi:type IV secretory pathway VirB4 component